MQTLSIIIPFYNSAATIVRTMRSLAVIAPEHRPRVRVIAVDDGSSDGSADLLTAAMAEVPGVDHLLMRQENGGSGSARNLALQQFGEGWTLFLDADDELIADIVPLLDDPSQPSALLFDTVIARRGRPPGRIAAVAPTAERLYELFSSGNPYPALAVVFRREELANLFDASLRYLEDWHFWAVNPQLFARCKVFSGTTLGRINVGPANKTGNQKKNGAFRIVAAEKIAACWGDNGMTPRVRNNLAVQKAIGALQMGEGRQWSSFFLFPVSITLYGKLIIYSFAYRLYLRFYPYA